ncbi:perlucin-like protein [Mytilus californianus]|uniref:perlucin-like protein n=1 Tax=Mytilus californianus TaxID=6549 RepID=UPI0022457C21|nr:perlucin-like protein [Mytilus californianus]
MIFVRIILLMIICKAVTSLPCLSNESKKDFDDSRIALRDMENHLGNTVKKLENGFKKITASIQDQLGVVKDALSNVGEKVKKVDSDFRVLGKDFQKTKWHKYNGHCYFYGSDKQNWFTAERKCREIGGYIAKIDDKKENEKLFASRPKTDDHLWIGLTDLNEGEYRWNFDQAKATYLPWHSGFGNKGNGYDCVAMINSSGGTWIDYICNTNYYYICESNFCF